MTPRTDSDRRALARRVLDLQPHDVAAALHGGGPAGTELSLLATGLAASPGQGSGPLVTDVDAALDAADRGEAPVLVMDQTGPGDEPAMRVAAAVVTARGGLASHAAVVARGWGVPAVCGVEALIVHADHIRVADVDVPIGEWLTVDGTTGEVRRGRAGAVAAPAGLSAELLEVLDHADVLAERRPEVLANADSAADADLALSFGARGVGLCRTEHLFLGDRLPLLQEVLLRGGADAAAELEHRQRADLGDLLAAADGRPVTVRLLDPPMHEFLPRPGDRSAPAELVALAEAWREENPMLGVRGVRLGILRPELVRLQVRALLGAVADRRAAGGDPQARLLVPMVTWPAEVEAVLRTVRTEPGGDDLPVGAMVETPSAAVRASELAGLASFLSFGTNDLTQLVLGLSRDDVEARLLRSYRDAGICDDSPFERLDPAVLAVMELAVAGAGADLPVGLCGEHGGDEYSVARCRRLGLASVSCSPYRVPLARLAAGRAAAAEVLGLT